MNENVSRTIFIEEIINELISEIIRKVGSQYCLYSKKKGKKGKHKSLGCASSKSGAKKREREVEYFKHAK